MQDPNDNMEPSLRERFDRFVAKVIPEYIARLIARARAEGYEEGKADGERIFHIVEPPPTSPSDEVDPGLYGPGRFVVSQAASHMRTQVATLVQQGLLTAPTEPQWSMIVADHPATCVSAGAGSGKSTTLVLRVVFMLEYLRIPDHEITVISFTKGSCKDLRRTLRRVLGLWRPHGVSEDWAKQRVRTFHSLLYGIAMAALPIERFFENVGGKQRTPLETHDDVVDVDNPMGSSKLKEEQAVLLNEAYRTLFAENGAFRAEVFALLTASLTIRPASSRPLKVTGWQHFAQLRDRAVTEALSQMWASRGWPFPGAEPTVHMFFKTMDGRQFFANGIEVSTRQPIVLELPDDATDAEKALMVEIEGCVPTTLGQAARSRISMIKGLSDRDFLIIGTTADAQAFSYRAQYATNATPGTPATAPIFTYTVPGEFKAVPIYEALFIQGSFIESLGKPVVTLLEKFPKPRVLDETVHFARALARFWPHFNQTLRRKRIMTYNEVLLALTSARPGQIPVGKLASVRHLLVDEFQDISPVLANWLKAMQRLLVISNQTLPVSIMAIGDDWQSIYGWRGSSPQLFIDFKDYFPAHEACGKAITLKFPHNFRSVKPVVDDAMQLLRAVQAKVPKDCIPVPPTQPGDHGVVLHAFGKALKTDEAVALHLAPLIEQRWKEALHLAPNTDDAVIVMTRRRSLRNALLRLLPASKYPKLQVLTYHEAKGLEAETAILVEDCAPGRPFPLRNMVFAASGDYPSYSYDQSVMDEAYRLAYVGVTRGRRRVVWAVPEVEGTTTAVMFKR